ncbi:hypothetical protein ACFL9T_18195 [Thermodesulfobacteriota bacterium]
MKEMGDIAGELRLLALNAMFERAKTDHGGAEFVRVSEEADLLALKAMDRIQKRGPVKLDR